MSLDFAKTIMNKNVVETSVGHIPGLTGNFVVESDIHKDRFADALSNFAQRLENPGAVVLERPILSPAEWLADPYYSGPLYEEFWPQKRKDFIEAAQGDTLEVLLTGCIDQDTIIQEADGGLTTLRDGLGQALRVSVLQAAGQEFSDTQEWRHSGIKQTMRFTLENGMRLRLTPDHKVEVYRDGKVSWLPSGELVTGDLVRCARKITTEPSEDISLDHAALLAYWIADGSSSHQGSRFCDGNIETVQEVQELLARNGWEGSMAAEPTHSTEGPPKCWEVDVRNHLKSWFRDWIISHGADKKTHYVEVPSSVCKSSNEVVAHFLNRLWACEGCVYIRPGGKKGANRFALMMTSEKIIRQVQMLLLRFSIQSRIRLVAQFDKRSGTTTDIWSLVVTGKTNALLWDQHIGAPLGKESKYYQLLEAAKRQVKALQEIYVRNSDVFWKVKDIELEVGEIEVGDIGAFNGNRFLCGGSISTHNSLGWGKSALLKALAKYDIYRLSCFKSPQQALNIGSSEWLVGVLVSLNVTKANDKLFNPLRESIDRTLYFTNEFPYNKKRLSVLEWPQKLIRVRAGVTSEHSVHSEDVFFLGMSEANFLPVVANSKKTKNGDVLDVAAHLLDNTERRMVSRFGVDRPFCRIVLDSSKQYPDDLVERRRLEVIAGTLQHKAVLIERSQWHAKRGVVVQTTGKPFFYEDPEGTPLHERKMFPVLVGDETMMSKILTLQEVEWQGHDANIVWVPPKLRDNFERDLEGSLRDLAGVSVLGIKPFISNRDALMECVRKEENGEFDPAARHPFEFPNGETAWSTTLQGIVNFVEHYLVDEDGPLVNPEAPRTIHIDIGLTSDCLGFAMGHIEEMVTVNRGRSDDTMPCLPCRGKARISCDRCKGRGRRMRRGTRVRCAKCSGKGRFACPSCNGTGLHGVSVIRPRVYIDLMLQVEPPKDVPIQLDDVEALITQLRKLGFKIPVVSADGHQSAHFLQRQVTYGGALSAEVLSVDRKKDAYYSHRDAIYDKLQDGRRRLSIYEYPPYMREISRVEERPDKVDHPANGSKDVADAVTGVIFNCETIDLLKASPSTGLRIGKY